MSTLKDYAAIVRSKNAGPFYITLEVFFRCTEDYRYVTGKNVFHKGELAKRYHVSEDELELYFCPGVNAVKLTYPRRHYAGSPMDSDVFGAQQHAPLMSLQVD